MMKIIHILNSRRNFLIVATLVVAVMTVFPVSAQIDTPEMTEDQEMPETNIIQKVIEESDGNVNIIIDDELTEKILKAPQGHKKNTNQGPRIRPGINRVSGYRIQVFADGRNQHSLEARAKARGTAISAKFPKYRGQIYTFASSPNWYTRIGNFRTQAEANSALAELRASFPSFADEMRVVKCQIVVIK